MKIRYYFSSDQRPLGDPANRGLPEAEELLARLADEGFVTERIDLASVNESEQSQLYAEHAVTPSVTNRYAIRQIFGTRRRGGAFFGRGVPALVVFTNGDLYPADVYPHQEGEHIVTIHDFLTSLLRDPAGKRAEYGGVDQGLNLAKINELARIRAEIFANQVLEPDSVEIIRDARERR